jgi:hypothetical protein
MNLKKKQARILEQNYLWLCKDDLFYMVRQRFKKKIQPQKCVNSM